MEAITILPQNMLGLIQDDEYHMCLSHLVGVAGMEEYTKFYRQQARELKHVTMDNGVIETGQSMAIRDIINAAMSIDADEIILPDYFQDRGATLAAIEEADCYIKDKGDLRYEFSFMAVPQGNSVEEWLECAEEIIDSYSHMNGGIVTCLGIPKMLTSLGGRDARLNVINILTETYPELHNFIDYHLLGCWQNPIEIMTIARAEYDNLIPKVRSVDSCLPYVYARAGMRFNEGERPDSNPIDFSGETEYAALDMLKLKLNILAWQDAANIGDEKTMWFL